MSKRLSVLLAAIVGVLAGTLLAGGALVGASAQPVSSATLATADQPARCVLQRLPAKLRADLKAARALPLSERRAAVSRIVKAARAGAYGKRAQKILERRAVLRGAIHHRLPADLRADLKKARRLPVGERKAALVEIRQDALAGKYGEKVQKLLEHRKERRTACRGASTA